MGGSEDAQNVAPGQAQLQAFYVEFWGGRAQVLMAIRCTRQMEATTSGVLSGSLPWLPVWERIVALSASAAGISHLGDLSQIALHLLPERTAHREGCDREIWFGGRHYQQANDDPQAYESLKSDLASWSQSVFR
eukprot:6188852-Pleurochrysis_carterae.AAC.1